MCARGKRERKRERERERERESLDRDEARLYITLTKSIQHKDIQSKV